MAMGVLLVGIMLTSCKLNPKPDGNTSETKNGDYTVKVIDSCEYLEYDSGFVDNRVYSITHKGNCRFCKERNKK